MAEDTYNYGSSSGALDTAPSAVLPDLSLVPQLPLSWSQHNTCLLSILLISITDACIPLILRFLINVVGILGAQVLNTSIFPTRARVTSGFFLHQSLEYVNPWGWSFNPHTGTSLRYGDCVSSPPRPATVLDAVPFQMQSFSDRFVMGTVSAQESRGSMMVPQTPPNLCVCFS